MANYKIKVWSSWTVFFRDKRLIFSWSLENWLSEALPLLVKVNYQLYLWPIQLSKKMITSDFWSSEHCVVSHNCGLRNWAQEKFLLNWLTHFQPMFHLYIPWKYQETSGFLMFSGVIKWNIGWKWVNLVWA